jgi:hypothetical protein
MVLIDAARPAAGQVFPQGLRFADGSEGIAQACLDQLVNAPQLPAALALPVEGVVPGGSRLGQPLNRRHRPDPDRSAHGRGVPRARPAPATAADGPHWPGNAAGARFPSGCWLCRATSPPPPWRAAG